MIRLRGVSRPAFMKAVSRVVNMEDVEQAEIAVD
jgi:hypothetical protein